MEWTYKDAGVDVESGYRAVKLMKEHISKTHTPGVIGDVGSFAGLYSPDLKNIDDPVLVSGTDGVGTKLQLAFILNKHDTIGIDCVAMCVNDIICHGARPLFFLDYLATGKLIPEKMSLVVKGIADGCIDAGCALIGGETAEMPGFYGNDEYDLAGFAVGIVDRNKIINGSRIEEGDILLGLESSGVHSNGYSLIRKLVIEEEYRLDNYYESLGMTLGEELLKPTKIYVKPILEAIKTIDIKGIAHITGGGFIENIPRIMPKGLVGDIKWGSWPISPIFTLLEEWGNIDRMDMYKTFNMGIGMVVVCSPRETDKAVKLFNSQDYSPHIIGKVIRDDEGADSQV